MRVLIIHAFGKTTNEAKRRDRFVSYVKEGFQQRCSTEVTYEIRDYQHIDDYIYVLDDERFDKSCLLQFDRLDFVFVDGSSKLHPWSPAAQKLCILLRMCYETGKCVYCVGFGALVLAYTVACSGEIYPIVNGHGRGDHLLDPERLKPPARGQEGACYLDNATGDIFSYSTIEGKWISVANCGMHKHGAPKIYDTYRVQVSKKDISVHPSFGEVAIHRAKRSFHHWIFDNILENEFLVILERVWNLHIPKKQNFVTVLGDSVFGVEILEYGHMIGMNFPVSEFYGQTLTMLGNFISQKILLMSKYDRVEYMSQSLFQKAASEGLRVSASLLNRKSGSKPTADAIDSLPHDDGGGQVQPPQQAQALQQSPSTLSMKPLDLGALKASASEISLQQKHSGLKHKSPHGSTLGSSTSLQANPIFTQKMQSELELLNGGGKASEIYRNVQLGLDDAPPPPIGYEPVYRQPPPPYTSYKATDSPGGEKPMVQVKIPSSRPRSAPLGLKHDADRSTVQTMRPSSGSSFKPKQRSNVTQSQHRVTDGSASNTTHVDTYSGTQAWNVSKAQSERTKEADRSSSSPHAGADETSFIGDQSGIEFDAASSHASGQSKRVVKVPPPSRPYTAYKKFEKMKQQSDSSPGNHPITYAGPYLSQEDMQRLEAIENKKKWVGPEFRVLPLNRSQSKVDSASSHSFHMIPYTGHGPNFRKEEKEKWISGNFSIYRADRRTGSPSTLTSTIYTRSTTPTDKSNISTHY
eukprot:TRINITY_DN2537_c0_g2_i4.p1 TRINITY_DN2537_c0_g2~~TRINITY_DN2537_c0_g2_i4.p1  ORF type:complete len:750 (-),score=103.34 TRINITY_DN2537_c0_g2_i4:441-2690(-)